MSGKWISFFSDAGIPSQAAATYALIFSENRITENMLLDLDREVLKEMGIQTMGDVISILKHARYVYEKTARETVLQSSSRDRVEKPVKKTVVSTVPVPENDPYFYSASTNSKKPGEDKEAPRKVGPVLPPNMKMPKVSSTTERLNNENGANDRVIRENPALKRKIKTSVQRGVIVKEETDDSDSSSDSSSSSSPEIVSKYRKVLPEPSNGASGTCSSGIAKAFTTGGTKRTVSILDREPEILPKSGTTFVITMSGTSIEEAKEKKPTKKSVFSRLDSKSNAGTSEESDPVDEPLFSSKHKEPISFDDDVQPTVEIINNLYKPSVQAYVKSDGRVTYEPVARVKPLVQTEGILAAKPTQKLKVGAKGRLGNTSPSPSYSQLDANLYDSVYDSVSTSLLSPKDEYGMQEETRLVGNAYHSNDNLAKKLHFSEILNKVSVPSMDYESVGRPSVKSRISVDQSPLRTARSTVPISKLASVPKQGITLNVAKPLGRISVAHSASSIKSRIGPQLSSSVRDRISLKPLSSVRDRISLQSPISVKDRITSVRERVSFKATPSIRERVGSNSAVSVRERISLKSVPSARERISLKAGPPVKERISLKQTMRDRETSFSSLASDRTKNLVRVNRSNVTNATLSARKSTQKSVTSVKARLGSSTNSRTGLKNIGGRDELYSVKKGSKSSDVFSRLG